MTDPVVDRVRRAVEEGPGPSEDLVARVTRAAGEAVEAPAPGARPRRRPSWRRPLVLAGAVAVLAGGGAVAAVMVDQGSETSVPLPPEAAAGVRESAVLARAPWLVPSRTPARLQTTRPLPSLRFPAGTTYPRALRRLVESLSADGTLPDEAALAAPLPKGAVWGRLRSGSRLDLTAPFGYAVPAGTILQPSFSFPPDLTTDEVTAIAEAIRREGLRASDGATLDIPRLRRCQLLARAKPCALRPVAPAR